MDLRKEYGINIPYHILLTATEWQAKRKHIIERDFCKCQECEQDGIRVDIDILRQITPKSELLSLYVDCTSLHVHHRRYIEGFLPWEYKDDDLITYCYECHRKWHEENEVEYFVYSNGEYCKKHYTVCGRCSGAGWFPEYSHRDGGICYECFGQRYKELLI